MLGPWLLLGWRRKTSKTPEWRSANFRGQGSGLCFFFKKKKNSISFLKIIDFFNLMIFAVFVLFFFFFCFLIFLIFLFSYLPCFPVCCNLRFCSCFLCFLSFSLLYYFEVLHIRAGQR